MRYNEVKRFIEENKRNPSKYRIEEHDMLNWVKQQRKLVNAGTLKPDRIEQFKEQIRIVKEVLHSRNHNPDIKNLVKGVMIESYIEEGCQKIGEGIYGKSITDPCLGWDDTERLLLEIAELA